MATGFLDDNESLMRMVGHTAGDVEVFTTAAQTGKSFYCLHFPVESVIASITASECSGETALQTTLPAGTTLFIGKVTAITLTSGIGIGYTR
jgi:hypothetical protein|tara:strand:+ start:51 stop:326 length:276 start_codon:yes stop_codon:yes gene_type:complete